MSFPKQNRPPPRRSRERRNNEKNGQDQLPWQARAMPRMPRRSTRPLGACRHPNSPLELVGYRRNALAALNRKLAGQQRRITTDVLSVYTEPDWQNDNAVGSCQFAMGKRIEFSSRPPLPEERMAQDDDAEAASREAIVHGAREDVPHLELGLVEPDAQPARTKLHNQLTNKPLLILRSVGDEEVVVVPCHSSECRTRHSVIPSLLRKNGGAANAAAPELLEKSAKEIRIGLT